MKGKILMNNFFTNDLGMVFLAFWGILTFLLFWYFYKIKPLNDDHGDPLELNEETPEIKNSLFETLREKNEIDHSTQNDPSTQDQLTIDVHIGEKQ